MADAVRLLSTLALKGAVVRFASSYLATTGTRIDADFAPTVALLARLRADEQADLVILTREGLDEAVAEGRVDAVSAIDVARSWVGIAVRAGAPHPDIATEAALRTTLLAGGRIAYSKIGASGIYFAELIQKLGIADAVNAKAIVTSGFTAERLMTGEADLAVQQISELKQIEGVEIVGPMPRALQTPAIFSAGRTAACERQAEAEELLRFLASPAVTPLLVETGLERP